MPHAAFAAARLACRAQLAGPAAPRARHVESHLSRLLPNRSRSAAPRAGLRRAHRARPVARWADFQARNGKFLHRAAHGIPEIDLHLVLEVSTRLMLRFHAAGAASALEKLAEQIAEAGTTACRARAAAKIKSTEIKIDVRSPSIGARSTWTAWWNIVAVEAVLVVHLPLLRVGQHVVGFLQLLEFFFRGFVAGIQVGMILARQLAKCRTNILRVCLPRHPK